MQSLLIIVFVILAAATSGYLIGGNSISDVSKNITNEDIRGKVIPVTNGVLDLSGKGLTKAPSYIFNRINIEELNLSNNNLEGALQAEIRHLQNLKVLNLSSNRFTGVPAEIGQLKELEVLDLSNNLLTGLPYELGNLSKLKLLDLSGNNYSEADLSKIRGTLPSSTVIKTN